ncbi:MAG: PQQ-like beta-propeller repeat protein, partial [Acidimicrobiales bacterium]|nr:PQQ-like beta-propeller repeat protein [Acidimicrobiales bacterium]
MRALERVARVLTALLILAGSAVVLVPEAPAAVTIGGVPNSLGLPFQSVGTVRASAVAGEWTYIGGSFLTVDGRSATRLARVSTATGEPDPTFDVAIGSPTSTTDAVHALAFDPATGVLYVGGFFTVAGGLSRSNLAAVDTATGQVISSWVANANNVVYSLVVDGSGLYVGGAFSSVTTTSATTRWRAMRLSTWTSATPTVTVDSWNPSLNSTVWAVAVDPARDQVLLGGDFSAVGSTTRVRLAAVDTATGTATTWYPAGGIAQSVRALAIAGDQVLVGISGGNLVLRVASLANNDAATAPLPSPVGVVNAIAVDQGAGVAYLGGSQTVAGRSRLVAVDTTTFAVRDWTPAPDAEVLTVAVTGDSVLAGGSFLNVADTARDGYALVSKAPNDGGTLGLDLDIEGAGQVLAAVRHGDTLFVGGDFTTLGGQPRNRLAAIDLTTNTVTDWVAPAPNNIVYHLEIDTGVSPPRLVVFGAFTLLGTTARPNLASLSTVDGSLTSWAPSLSSNAGLHGIDIDVTGRSLFVAHNTAVPAGRTVARVHLDTGAVSNFADTRADHSSVVVAADPVHRRVYVGGTRSQVTTVAPVYTAQTAVITAFDMDTGAQLWRSTSDTGTAGNVTRNVTGLAVDPTRGQLVLTGSFASWGGASRGCVAVLDASTGVVTGWNPFPACFGTTRSAVAVADDRLWVGDVWTNVGGAVQGGVAAFDLSTQTVLAPGAMFALRPGLGTATVRTVVPLADGGAMAGGYFTTVGTVETAALARLTDTGAVVPTPLPAWRLGAGSVNAVAWQGDVVWMAGNFESARDQQRSNLLAYDTATDTLLPSPSVNGLVSALAVDGSVLYLGGVFTAVDGQSRTRLAAIHATDGLTNWAPETNNQVTALAVDRAPGAPARLWIGGVFSTIRDPGGALRTSVSLAATRLDTGLVDTTIPNPGFNSTVRALAVHGNRLYLGGAFTTSAVGTGSSTVANRLAALDRATGVVTDWRPNANGQVNALAVAPDGTVYAGGTFSLLNGEVRNRLAAIAPDGSATSWNPNLPLANQTASVMTLAGGQVWVGGAFTQVGSTPVAYLAAVDPTTQQAIASGPRVNSTVNAVAFDASGTRLVAGGVFTQAEGVNRSGAVVARMASGGLAPRGRFVDVTGPLASGAATIAFARHGGVLYAGGSFTHVGGRRRRGLAAIDLRSNALLPWNPDPSGTVNALAVDASGGTAQLVVGGAFTTIAGVPRNGLAAFQLTPAPSSVATGMVVTPPGVTVNALVVDPQRRLLYAGDNFGWVRSVDLSTGAAGAWSTSTGQPIGALALDPTRRIVYVGGNFGSFLGVSRTRLAAFDAETGNVLPWNPGADGTVSALAVSPQTGAVFAGGSFLTVAGQTRNRIVHLS